WAYTTPPSSSRSSPIFFLVFCSSSLSWPALAAPLAISLPLAAVSLTLSMKPMVRLPPRPRWRLVAPPGYPAPSRSVHLRGSRPLFPARPFAPMSDRYTVISSNCHAGLAGDDYRPYLEAKHHPAFDEFLAERQASRDEALKLNYEYIMNWETHNEEGLRGAYDAEQRDKELDADGVSAEVIFADSDAITGKESPPFGAGLSAGEIRDPELAFAGARAHNRFLVELCATSPERRGGIALVPIIHGVERSVE